MSEWQKIWFTEDEEVWFINPPDVPDDEKTKFIEYAAFEEQSKLIEEKDARISFLSKGSVEQLKVYIEQLERIERLEKALEKSKKLVISLGDEIDPRGGEHDPGFISQKGCDVYAELFDLYDEEILKEG